MSTPPTLLVTGGAGFIGSTFVRLAKLEGYRLVVLDALTYAGRYENISDVIDDTCTFVKGTINDPDLCLSLMQTHAVTAVVHLAAESHVDNSIAGPRAFFETNVMGTVALLQASLTYWRTLPAAQAQHFRFLHVSTDEVFGTLGDSGYFNEGTAYKPNSPYSASKAASDHAVRAWHHTYQLPVITCNCSNNYGPRQHTEKLIPHMISCALKGKSLPVYGNGKNIRDWIHVEDHGKGLLLALSRGIPGESYCFGGNCERQNLNVVRDICTILDDLRPRSDGRSYHDQIQFVTDRLGHDFRYAIDSTKAEAQLGFTRTFPDFESGLRQTITWYLDHPDWTQSRLENP